MTRKLLCCTLVAIAIAANSASALAPVRVAKSYEDSLRIVIAFHVGTSLCMFSGGRAIDLVNMTIDAIDTSRVDKVSIQYHNREREGYDDFSARDLISRWGKDSLPHAIVFINGDSKVGYYGNVLAGYFAWAGENKIGIVAIGPYGIKENTFFADTAATMGDAPLYDARWLLDADDSVCIRLKPVNAIPETRKFYPNTNGILRNTIAHILPKLPLVSTNTLYCKPFGGAGRCKMWGITLSDPYDPHYTGIAFEQGYNARKDTLYDFLRDAEGKKQKDTNGVYIYKEIYVDAGIAGGESQYQAVTVYHDTITTFYYDAAGKKRDARTEDPVVRRAVMVNFNPGYLIHRAAAEQIVYDAVMYASTTHLIGKTMPESAPPNPLDVVAANKAAQLHQQYLTKHKQKISGIYTVNGRFIPASTQTIKTLRRKFAPGVYLIPKDGKKKLSPAYLVR